MFFKFQKKTEKKVNDDVIRASLFGFFVGDALGVPVEFKSREELDKKKVTQMIGYGTYNQPEGTWSDDSSMVLATIDGLFTSNGKKIDYKAIMKNFLDWKIRGKFTPFNYVFDIGNATNKALSRYLQNIQNDRSEDIICGESDINSNGNGSLMRILPIALYLKYINVDYKDPDYYNIIKTISGMTHAHIYSCFACYIYSIFVSEIINCKDMKIAYKNLQLIMKKIIEENNDFDKVKEVYSRIIYQDIYKLERENIKSSSYVVDSLEAAIWSVMNSKSFSEAVLKAVNLGNDTDTIGALTGALAGIAYGYENIPKIWIQTLKAGVYLKNSVESFEIKMGEKKAQNKNNINIDEEDLKKIETFISAVKTKKEVFKLQSEANLKDGTPIMYGTQYDYENEFEKVREVISKYDWWDLNYIENLDKMKGKNIEAFSFDEVKTYITKIVRSERFCSGAIYEACKDGTLLRAIERLYGLIK